MRTIRVLTKLSTLDPNHGSACFDLGLAAILKSAFPGDDVRFLKINLPTWLFYELGRAFKPRRNIPFFNLQRYITLSRFGKHNLPLEPFSAPWQSSYPALVEMLKKRDDDLLVVSKVVWDIAHASHLAEFPNIAWLSDEIRTPKIAYAVSGHRTDLELFRQNKDSVRRLAGSFKLIGVRDDMTAQMMAESGVDQQTEVLRVMDPAFQFEHRPVDTRALLKKHGLDPDRPIFGMLFYGKPALSDALAAYYRGKGCQVISFGMYNQFSDANLGHRVDPHEWAALFETLEFCVTDRFHASIYCIRQGVPFAAIEPFAPKTETNSKLISLLKDFNLETAYQGVFGDQSDARNLIGRCEEIKAEWGSSLYPPALARLKEAQEQQREFVSKIQAI